MDREQAGAGTGKADAVEVVDAVAVGRFAGVERGPDHGRVRAGERLETGERSVADELRQVRQLAGVDQLRQQVRVHAVEAEEGNWRSGVSDERRRVERRRLGPGQEPECDRQRDVGGGEDCRGRGQESPKLPGAGKTPDTGGDHQRRQPDDAAQQDAGGDQKHRHAAECPRLEPGNLLVGQAVEDDRLKNGQVQEASGPDHRVAGEPEAGERRHPQQPAESAQHRSDPAAVEQRKQDQRRERRDRTLDPVVQKVGDRDGPPEQQRTGQQADCRVAPPDGKGRTACRRRLRTFAHKPG